MLQDFQDTNWNLSKVFLETLITRTFCAHFESKEYLKQNIGNSIFESLVYLQELQDNEALKIRFSTLLTQMLAYRLIFWLQLNDLPAYKYDRDEILLQPSTYWTQLLNTWYSTNQFKELYNLISCSDDNALFTLQRQYPLQKFELTYNAVLTILPRPPTILSQLFADMNHKWLLQSSTSHTSESILNPLLIRTNSSLTKLENTPQESRKLNSEIQSSIEPLQNGDTDEDLNVYNNNSLLEQDETLTSSSSHSLDLN